MNEAREAAEQTVNDPAEAAERKDLLEVLEACEWAWGGTLIGPGCPVCATMEDGDESQHEPYCKLNAILSRLRQGGVEAAEPESPDTKLSVADLMTKMQEGPSVVRSRTPAGGYWPVPMDSPVNLCDVLTLLVRAGVLKP